MSHLAETGASGHLLPTMRPDPAASQLAALVDRSARNVYDRTNRLFAWLLFAQWLCVTAAAIWGDGGTIAHPVLVSLLAGGLCTVPAILLIRSQPHAWRTRVVVALSQSGFSVLLAQVTDSPTEMPFHVLGSLAVLSLYRDWRILPVASAVAILHRLLAAMLWPAALSTAQGDVAWRMVEYSGWIAILTVVLAWACVTARREMREACVAQDQNQRLLAELEQRVRERTSALETEIAEREKTASALRRSEQQHRELISRLPIGVFETTLGGRVNFANAHLLSLVGLPPHIDARAISLADGVIFPLAERQRLWHRLENLQEVRGFNTTLHHFDGTSFDVVINARLKTVPVGDELAAEGTVEDVTVRKRAERELEELHAQLLLASRQAGMAEVATGVLHNVGNVLTSVNLIVHDVQDRLKSTRLVHLRRVIEALEREKSRLGEFLTVDPTGRQLPDFLTKLDRHLTEENVQLIADVEGLVRHFEHIREIIVTQQGSAQLQAVIETLAPAQLCEDALRLNADAHDRHGILVDCAFGPVAQVRADRHKVLQILVNVLKNAKDALQVRKPGDRLIRIRVTQPTADRVALSIEDNGAGITSGDLTRIFQHGYTTKKSGHGFGLHSSVLAAREMGGDLVAASPGPGLGATFTLTLPSAPVAVG